MIFGSIVDREALTMPRRSKHFVFRALSIVSLFVLICTTWLMLAGIQPLSNLGDVARFSAMVFQILGPLHLIIVMFSSCLAGCTAVSNEKDRRTLILLLMTTLSNWELVIGKMSTGLLTGVNLLFSGLIAMIGLTLFGGVSPNQVIEVGWIAVCTIFACSAWGTMVAFWREKTFQSIAVSLLGMVLYFGAVELISAGRIPSMDRRLADLFNPIRSTMLATKPIPQAAVFAREYVVWGAGAWMLVLGMGLSGLSIVRLRVWNPSREGRPKRDDDEVVSGSIERNGTEAMGWKVRSPRPVWDNPILWREVCTWAYGRKVLLIRLSYLIIGLAIAIGLPVSLNESNLPKRSISSENLVPVSAQLLVPLFVVSLTIINALAVNSITNERDGQALDLILVSEITPTKFLFGKLLGVLYVSKEMVGVPIAIGFWLWIRGSLSGENLAFLVGGLVVMDVFVAMLGLHCGMIYSRSKLAIATSLGTVFFLFLGILTCMLIMISFRGSFERQLAPFLAIILGGGSGLYLALGAKNPSPAITLAAFGLPFMTFFAITSFILRGQELTVFSVIATAYGFATLAMMIPALSEFEFSFGKSHAASSDS